MNTRRPSAHNLPSRFVTAVLTGALAYLSACGTQTTGTVNTGLDRLIDGRPAAATLPDQVDPSRLDAAPPSQLLALLEQAQQNSAFEVDPGGSSAPPVHDPNELIEGDGPGPHANGQISTSLDDLLSPSGDSASDVPVAAAPEPESPVIKTPDLTPAQLRTQAAQILADSIVDQSPRDPGPALIRLAALALAAPDQAQSIATAAHGIAPTAIAPRQGDMLSAWRRFVERASTALDSAQGMDGLIEPTRKLADDLDAWQPLSITRKTLCTSVDGFGRYVELNRFDDSYKFLAGRPINFIVYLELDHFTRTSKSVGGVWGYEVSITQDLRLYHMAAGGDTLVWRRPDQQITDFSRNVRRDFFVVQLVKLPATLSVGGYRLKITLTDRASGDVAEQIIPLQIVANISALKGQ